MGQKDGYQIQLHVLLGGLCAIPLAWLVALVAKDAVNVPFWDEWSFIPMLQKSYSGQLAFRDLWAQANEHRLVFPRLVFLALAHLTHWDLRAEMFASLVVAVATLVLLLFVLRRTPGVYGWWLVLAGTIFAWFILSPLQYENWLWGWQLQWFLCDVSAIGAIALLALWPETRPPWLGIVLAVAAGVVASFSLASGLLVWPACLAVFYARKDFRRWLPLWVASGAIVIASYLNGYKKPHQDPSLVASLRHPVQFASYVLHYLGTPAVGLNGLAPVAGFGIAAAFLCTSIFLAVRAPAAFRRSVAWVTLGVWAVMGAAMTAVGRVGFGVAQSEASRYTSASLLLLLSTVALVFAVVSIQPRPKLIPASPRVVIACMCVVLAIGLANGFRVGLAGMNGTHIGRLQNHACLASAQGPSDPCLAEDYPGGGQRPWTLLQYLRQAHVGGM